MSKKERNINEATIVPQELAFEEEPMYEAEAYTSPQPDAGSDITVLKPVGAGGPVPIVAPKHNTIQLQPIIVPLAVVPYMTQDSAVLRTDGRTQQPYYSEQEESEAAEFKAVEKEKAATRTRTGARLFAFVSLLFALVTTVPFILAYFKVKSGVVDFSEFNSIIAIESWVRGTAQFAFRPITRLLMIVIMAMSMLSSLLALIGLIVGKYPKPLICLTEFASLACLLAILIKDICIKNFVLENRIMFIVVLALTALAFLLTVVFSVLINKREDRADERGNEI